MPADAEKPDVFLDSSVVIAALLSPTGGSFRLFTEANKDLFRMAITTYVRDEVRGALERKYPLRRFFMDELLRFGNVRIVANPSATTVAPYLCLIIDPADAPILAGAVITRSGFLITLDRRHFMTARLAKADFPFTIATPKSFLETMRKKIS